VLAEEEREKRGEPEEGFDPVFVFGDDTEEETEEEEEEPNNAGRFGREEGSVV
jgi:hypothetical protein